MASSKQVRKLCNSIDEIGGIVCNLCSLTLMKKFNFDRHYKTHGLENDIIVYTCLICYKEIPSYISFREHCYQHILKRKNICHKCERTFSKTQALVDHLKNIHGLGIYACPAPCNQTFNNLDEFKNHTKEHKQENTIQCQTCKTDLTNQNAAEDHINEHTEYDYSCPICNAQFSDKDAAPSHLHTHFENETLDLEDTNEPDDSSMLFTIQVGCHICKTSFKIKDDFEHHFSTEHGNEIVYSCGVCWKTFDVYLMFSNHRYNHLVKAKFKCDICEKTFSRLNLLVLHMETLHSTVEQSKPFPCMECEMEFSSGKGLKAHLLDTHGVAYQICPHPGCGKIFDSPTALVFHQVDHKETPEKRCQTCGLPFKSLLACFRHMGVHKKIKYTCPICSRKYVSKYLGLKHVRQHYQAAMHMCTECGKTYNLKSRLLEHIKSHNKLNTCTYCKKKFPSKASLNDHLNVHTKQTPYECWVCHKKFSAASGWRKHMKNIHNKSTKKSDLPLISNITNNKSNTKLNNDENEVNYSENNNVSFGDYDVEDIYFNKKVKKSSISDNGSDSLSRNDEFSNDRSGIKDTDNDSNYTFENNDSFSNEEINNIENINVNGQKGNYLIVDGEVINDTDCSYTDNQINKVNVDNKKNNNIIIMSDEILCEKDIKKININNLKECMIIKGQESNKSSLLLNNKTEKVNTNGEITEETYENNNYYNDINDIESDLTNNQITDNNVENIRSLVSNDEIIQYDKHIYINNEVNKLDENVDMSIEAQMAKLHDDNNMCENNKMELMEISNLVANEQINIQQINDNIIPNESEINFENNIVGLDINNLMEALSDSNDCEKSDETAIDEDEKIIMEIGSLTEDLMYNPPLPPPAALPLDYGPDFLSTTSINSYEYNHPIVYLNESVYPHVDPRLMTNNDQIGYTNPQQLPYLQGIGYNVPQIINPMEYQTILPFT